MKVNFDMGAIRRTFLSAAVIGMTMLNSSALASGESCANNEANYSDTVAELINLSSESNAALMRGDLKTYRKLIIYSDDFTLMSPFGGTPSRASEYTDERMKRMASFFRNGIFEQEVVHAYASKDIVVLAIIERQTVEVGGLPAQEWPLRVTLVYRRDGNQWLLAHRHADPLVSDVTLYQAAALARGERPTISK